MKIQTLAAASLLAFSPLVLAMPTVARAADAGATVKLVDTDKDGSIDLTEAKKAALNKFATLDADHDGTLDSKEAGMDVKSVDPDKDGTVDKAEFETSVADSFKAADTDHDGTVDAKELATPAGQKLESMID